jgi:hypothetical protein
MRCLAAICMMAACLSTAPATGQDSLANVSGQRAVAPVGKPLVVGDMTHEETVVRTAYAKFAYASEQDAMDQLAMEVNNIALQHRKEYAGLTSDQRLTAARVTFTLTDFVVGNIHDILSRKAIDFISPAQGEMLTATTPVSGYGEGGQSILLHSIRPSWQPARPTPPEALEVKLDDLYQFQWRTPLRPDTLWQRYASYSVSVDFQGKSRGPYKALFIFGHDDRGNEVVYPEDGTTDALGLASALHEHLFPEPYVRTRLRNSTMITDWLKARQMSGQDCSVGQGDVCCDLATMQCGPGQEDIAKELAKPLPTR